MTAPPSDTVDFAVLPVAGLLTRDGIIVAVNRAYETLMGVSAEEIVGQSVETATRRFVRTRDIESVEAAAAGVSDGSAPGGTLWCGVIDGTGRSRTLKVIWQPHSDALHGVVYLLDADDDAVAKAVAEVLARAGGDLVSCSDETAVLAGAVGALASHGFIASTLLLHEGDPLLAYGPSCSPPAPETEARAALRAAYLAVRPSRDVLTQINPRFYERRAAFFRQGDALLDGAYPATVAASLKQLVAGRHMVQAPVFVDGRPYGAIVVTGGFLTPALAGTIEMFAELVARAIESVRAREHAIARLEQLTRLQGELVQRERLAALGEAAAVMAHEVRNPIAAILNAVSVLRRNAPASQPGAEMYRVIAEEAARLERLVSDLLDLGRPLLPRLRSVDLTRFIADSIEVLARRGEASSVFIELAACPEPVAARIDPDLMQLALLNVLINAAQASPSCGRVAVWVAAVGDRRVITVDDGGPGFSAEVSERMFEPFFTTRATGTGIGLAVVRRIVEANHGVIRIGVSPAGGGRVEMEFAASSLEDGRDSSP